jgi:hypothetical protein
MLLIRFTRYGEPCGGASYDRRDAQIASEIRLILKLTPEFGLAHSYPNGAGPGSDHTGGP